MNLESIDNIMDQIPDVMMRKYSLNISNNILENGTIISFGNDIVSLHNNDLLSIRNDIHLLLKNNQVPLCTIRWELDIPIFSDDIVNLFEDHTIIEVLSASKSGTCYLYHSYTSKKTLCGHDMLYERFGRFICVYFFHEPSILITRLDIKRTIQSILHGG